MKRIKKLAGLMLAMIMVLGMTMTAFATNTNGGELSGEVPPEEVPTTTTTTQYELFQIFVGNYKDGKLSNAKWGINGSGYNASDANALVQETVLTELSEANNLSSDTEKLEKITKYANLDSTPFKGVSEQPTSEGGKYKYTNLPSGYYLIRGSSKDANGNNEVYTLYVVQVIGDGEANEEGITQDTGNGTLVFEPKRNGVPTPDKKVKDKDDTTGAETDWQSSADYDIGDEIPYQLKATLPDAETLGVYNNYKLVFEDELCKGLDYVYEGAVENGITVKVNDAVVESGYTVAYDGPSGDGVNTDTSSRKLTITFDNVKGAPINAKGGEVITVEYEAKLNQQAEIGKTGNLNTFTLKYSNNPNNNGSGESMGTTPPKTAVVFTFKTVVNKVDDQNKALAGAAFTLAKLTEGEWVDITTFDTIEDDATTFNFTGLDDGRYRLTESKTPAGYNSINPIYFMIVATHTSDDGTNGALTNLDVYETNEEGTKISENNTAKFNVVIPDGTATTDIVNKSGSLLPSTGGIGTTIFYVVGGILVVGAGILLVAKKRMGAHK